MKLSQSDAIQSWEKRGVDQSNVDSHDVFLVLNGHARLAVTVLSVHRSEEINVNFAAVFLVVTAVEMVVAVVEMSRPA